MTKPFAAYSAVVKWRACRRTMAQFSTCTTDNPADLLLIANGLVRTERIKVGRVFRLMLQTTDQARSVLLKTNALNNDTKSAGSGSLIHEYWKHFYARRFEKSGYHIELEAPRLHSRMDVLAMRASERVGIEVETGKSDVVWNVKQDLLAGCKRVIVVATDEEALRKVERKLAQANLIIPRRVSILLRDETEFGSFAFDGHSIA